MATITEMNRIQSVTEETDARRKLNAMIRDCYRRLQNAESTQFMQETVNTVNVNTVRASVIAPERPVQATPALEQTPQITQYVRTHAQSHPYADSCRAQIPRRADPAFPPCG